MQSEAPQLDSLLSYIEDGNVSIPSLLEALIVRGTGSLLVRGEGSARLTDQMVSDLVRLALDHGVCPQAINLKFHSFGDNAVAHLCHLAKEPNSRLEELDLEGNEIGVGGCIAIEDLLRQESCRLLRLDLSWNPLGSKGGEALADAFEANWSLQSLRLANCGFDYNAIVSLAVSIRKQKNLISLNLDRPIYTKSDVDKCAEHLANMVENHPCLSDLSLRYHGITDHGAYLYAQAFTSAVPLVRLDLSCNSIGVPGCEHLASYILQSPTLEHVSISNNVVGDEGALALAKAISGSRSLTSLHVRNNGIRVTGLCALARALDSSGTGTGGAGISTSTSGNRNAPFSSSGQAMSRSNTTNYGGRRLRELFLWGNEFENTSAELFLSRIANIDSTTTSRSSNADQQQQQLHSTHSFSRFVAAPAPVLTDFIVYVVDGVHLVAQRPDVK